MPERPTTTQIPVQWAAMEDGSGLRGYDVEVKVDDGDWARVLTYTQNTTTTYPAEMGHTYAFRVRATDNVSNSSAWVEGVARTVTVKKYYHVAGQRVAMRSNNVIYWIHGDHLGSTSLTTNISGTVVAEQKYLPYGEVRWVTGTLATDFTYTGQRADRYIKLTQMGARWYDGRIGRWISADPIIPDFSNPQSLNRFMYVFGNVLKLIDPSGYDPELWQQEDLSWTLDETVREVAILNMAIMIFHEQRPNERAMIAAANILWNDADHSVARVRDTASSGKYYGHAKGHPSEDTLARPGERPAWEDAQRIARGVIGGESDYEDETSGALYFANVLVSEEETYEKTLARTFQEQVAKTWPNGQWRTQDQILKDFGYGSFEINEMLLFVYNNFGSVGIYGPGTQKAYTVRTPREPMTKEEWDRMHEQYYP